MGHFSFSLDVSQLIWQDHVCSKYEDFPFKIIKVRVILQINVGLRLGFDFIECFTTTFLQLTLG